MPFTVTVSATVPLAPNTAEPVMAAVVLIVGPGWIVTHSMADVVTADVVRDDRVIPVAAVRWRRSSRCPRPSG